jgi:hypothetical protein
LYVTAVGLLQEWMKATCFIGLESHRISAM